MTLKGSPAAIVDGAVMPVMMAFAPESMESAPTAAADEIRILTLSSNEVRFWRIKGYQRKIFANSGATFFKRRVECLRMLNGEVIIANLYSI